MKTVYLKGSSCRVPSGTVDVVLSYCHYSLNDTSLTDLIPYLKQKGVGIVNAGILSMGLLTKYVSRSDSTLAEQNLVPAPSGSYSSKTFQFGIPSSFTE